VSFSLPCPFCGPRPVDEYAYFGEVTKRPGTSPTLRELTDYVYFRDNVAGVQRGGGGSIAPGAASVPSPSATRARTRSSRSSAPSRAGGRRHEDGALAGRAN